MSFWQANTKLAIGQKSVSIPAEVQGEYGENGKITIKIDPSTEFFQPTESYLSFRLKLKLGNSFSRQDIRCFLHPSFKRPMLSVVLPRADGVAAIAPNAWRGFLLFDSHADSVTTIACRAAASTALGNAPPVFAMTSERRRLPSAFRWTPFRVRASSLSA